MKTWFDLLANFIATEVSASHGKSTQVQARSGQTESEVDQSFQLVRIFLRERLAKALETIQQSVAVCSL